MANTSIEELLPQDDVAFLNAKHPGAQVYAVGNEVHVLLQAFPLPAAYVPRNADLLIRLPAGYPDTKPDMFWTRPDVKLVNGAWPAASEHHEVPGSGNGVEIYAGLAWQRWSRHYTSEWRPGVDGMRNFVGAIKTELARHL